MKFFDQLNRIIEIPSFPPRRIISVVPSQTELLFDLGVDQEVLAITKFCVHPEHWFRNKTRIGGTKKLNLSLISQLKPDLIIANKEENLQAEIEELTKQFPVWISDIKNLEGAYDMIERVGVLVERKKEAHYLIEKIKTNFFNYLQIPRCGPQPSPIDHRPSNKTIQTAYFIWKEPYMTAGGDTFINDMMKCCGFENVFEKEMRYPQVSLGQLSAVETAEKSVRCQLILLSSEPYPFKQKHVKEMEEQLPDARIILVDGEMFSWYGSRLQYAPAYFQHLRELVFNS